MSGGVVQNLSYILLGEDRTASKAMQAAESTAQKVTGSIGSAFSKLGGVIGGEFGGYLQSAGADIQKLSEKGKSLTATLEVGGAITAGAGFALMNLGSGAKQASDQLDQAIVANGESTEHFASQIEDAVKAGENFGHSAEDTKAALTTLVPATGSTAAALSYMNVVTNLAAARHQSLADSATQVTKILAGSGTRTLNQYGIQMDGVGSKTQQGQHALDQLSQKLDGQASASMKNFGAQVDADKTKLEDWVKDAAGPAGQVLTVLGPAIEIAGVALDIHRSRVEAHTRAQIADNAVTTEAVAATDEEAVAMDGLDASMDANPIGLVAASIGLLAGVVGGGILADTQSLTNATQDYTTALENNNGAINENIRALATKKLLDSGALKAANELGISTSLVVSATLGDAKAKGILESQVASLNGQLNQMTDADNRNAASGGVASAATEKLAGQLGTLTQNVGLQSQALKDGKAQADLYNSGLKTTADNASAAAGQVGYLADQLDSLGRTSPAAVNISVAPSAHNKLHAAGGSFIANSSMQLTPFDTVGESGPERVDITPLNAGRPSSGGGGVNINVTLAPQMMFGGTVQQQAQALHGALVNLYKSGGAKTELKHALGIAGA